MSIKYNNRKFEITLFVKENSEAETISNSEWIEFIESSLIEKLEDVAIIDVKAI